MSRSLRKLSRFLVGLMVLGYVSCSTPVSSDKDLLEMERVWQYLKVFSIWQDRVPSDPFEGFATPQDLTAALHDTIHDATSYSTYWPPGQVPPGVLLLLSRAGETAIDTPSVEYSTIQGGIPRIRIKSFDGDLTVGGETWPSTYTRLLWLADSVDTADKLVIDLRDNGGGELDVLDDCVELFLPPGKRYIEKTSRVYDSNSRSAHTTTETQRTLRTDSKWEGKRIGILINENTASAAEIFAAGLRDALGSDSVTLVGDTTFGKAIGQYYRLLASEGAIRITAFTFRRVTGDSATTNYFQTGVPPDEYVANDAMSESRAVQMLTGMPRVYLSPPPAKALSFDRSDEGLGCYKILRDGDVPPSLLE